MRRIPIVLIVLLMLAVAGPAGAALEATPFASPDVTSQPDLAGIAPLPLTGERRTAFEAYIADAMHRFGVPGASVAVVQGGNVVYLQGFGVREAGGAAPVTPDTLMMIGSVNKSLTSTMAATLVDDGSLAWDTPLVDLLPVFAVADADLTTRLTVADAFCACTGLPQRDVDLAFNFGALTPERLIASVADFPLTAPLGETFQYSNQMYAIGGYAAAVAAGAGGDVLFNGYQLAMRDRILGPMGMEHSTFALDEVLASGDYAVPHGADLDGRTQRVPLLLDDGFVNSVAPAAALWSNSREMARYLQTELAGGVAPDGTRVVSAENLARTRAPRVAIPAEPGLPPLAYESAESYGMGWFVGEYKGQPLVSHSGGTLGFASELDFLPEADLGVVILTNGSAGAGPFTLAVRFRLLEMLFDQPQEIDPLLTQLLAGGDAGGPELGQVDPVAIEPYLGRYTNPALGEVNLLLENERLVIDAGEFRSTLRPLLDEAGQVIAYIFADPPLAGEDAAVALQQGADGRPEVVLIEGEGAATYIFTRLEVSATAIPAS